VEEEALLRILRVIPKLKELGLEVFVGGTIWGEERSVMRSTQGYPTDQLPKFHLVKLCKNIY